VPDNRLLPDRLEDRSYAPGAATHTHRETRPHRLREAKPHSGKPEQVRRVVHDLRANRALPMLLVRYYRRSQFNHTTISWGGAGAVATAPAGPCSFLVLPSTRSPPFVGLFSLIVRSNGYSIDRHGLPGPRTTRDPSNIARDAYKKAPWLSRSKRSLISLQRRLPEETYEALRRRIPPVRLCPTD
jgi:hypothetical protein